MSKSLGRILQKLRKEQRITQKELSRGLCSISTLSKIESGEREPEQLLFDSLISRLGKDSNKWELILKEDDKQLLRRRKYIEYLIRVKNWSELESELENYSQLNKKFDNLQEQYVDLSRAILYKETGQYNEALQSCYRGLEKTNLKIDKKYFRIEERISRNELKLLCLIGEILYHEESSMLNIYIYWKEILRYIDNFCTDIEYRLQPYIKAKYYLSLIFYEKQGFKEENEDFQSAINELVSKKSIFYLREFIEMIKKVNININFNKLSKIEIDVLQETLIEWGIKLKNIENKKEGIRTPNSIYSINEIIRNSRLASKKTQEEVVEIGEENKYIGDQASLSEIEHGKRNPREITKQHYMKKFGLEGKEDNFQLPIYEENFEVQELRWEIDFAISTHDILEAEKLLYKLKEKIDLFNVYNEQYIRAMEQYICIEKKIVSSEDWEKNILDILSLTIKNIEEIKMQKIAFFTREELFLLINLGVGYHMNMEYNKALKYYEGVEKYFCNSYELSSSRIYKVVLYNLSQIYGLLGKYKESMEKSRKCIFLEMLEFKGYSCCRAIYNIGWCYGKMMLEEKESLKKEEYKKKCNKYFRQSYVLAKFYKDEPIEKAIRDKRKIWNL